MQILNSYKDAHGNPCAEVISFRDSGHTLYMVDVLHNGTERTFTSRTTARDYAQAETNRYNRVLQRRVVIGANRWHSDQVLVTNSPDLIPFYRARELHNETTGQDLTLAEFAALLVEGRQS